MRFNWRNKKFLSGLFTVVLLGVGVANPEIVGQAGAGITCAVVVCDAA